MSVEIESRNVRFEGLYQSTLPDFLNSPHIVVGVGAIGGVIIKILGQMAIKSIEIWDHDDIETANIATQGFHPKHVGRSKVWARTNSFIKDNPQASISPHVEKFKKRYDHPQNAYWWLMVDSLRGREFIYKTAMACNPKKIIDARMSGLAYEVYNINIKKEISDPDNKYLTSIQFARDHPVTEGCSSRSTPHCSMLAGSIAINLGLTYSPPFCVKGNMMTYEQSVQWG